MDGEQKRHAEHRIRADHARNDTRPATLGQRILCVLASTLLLGIGLGATLPISAVHAQTRIKDIVDVEGVRDNLLVGYGLVVGLQGTGDRLQNAVFTRESLVGMLERLGVNARSEELRTRNIAAVMVTATLPPFRRQGTRIDVVVSALGDAASLRGGTLLVTPLVGADGEVYAVSQGPLAVGGVDIQQGGASFNTGVVTAGSITSGAIIEREIPYNLLQQGRIMLSLKNADFSTARNIEETINQFAGEPVALMIDPATIIVIAPSNSSANGLIRLLTDIEQLPIATDAPAKVVVNEKTGVIVMGDNVRINQVAIAQENLTIRVTTQQTNGNGVLNPFLNRPAAEETTIDVIEENTTNGFAVVNDSPNLRDLIEGLNQLGVTPRDMISILQAIKAAGALQAEIEVM
ncbi:MAG: flagellar basal body P-ring protein FlgI [Alphaproteobacteria bacterium]|nr:flagellar basal body P-ring protein FlgI [Alphaproteobacteria bacterium]